MPMTPNARICVDLVLKHEGGLSMNPKDPGNWTGGEVGKGILKGTKYGIAASAHPDLDIENLTVADAESIYEAHYWPLVHGDDLPLPLAMVTLDAAVMSGTGSRLHERAIGWLQRGVGVAEDSIIGPATIAAARRCNQRTAVVIACSARLNFLKALRIWPEFGDGWGNRVDDTQAAAIAAIGG